ncbi:MAG: hypothetical protein JXR51_06085 [Bacteroidales bacterium]|nr:hypothetical protein [Bacteroidales bacterium]MBN2756730.1 hypothetical protein [Bacteroidales bacterium]
MKKLILTLILIFTFQINFIEAQINLSDYNCIIEPIKYKEDTLENRLILCINYKDEDNFTIQYSDIYLLNKKNENILLTKPNDPIIGLYDLKASKNYKYLAFYYVGEGHPWIEIIDLQAFTLKKEYNIIAEIQAYPGNVNLLYWSENDMLIIESDINLLLKNSNKNLNYEDMFDIQKKYYYDIKTKQFSICKEK